MITRAVRTPLFHISQDLKAFIVQSLKSELKDHRLASGFVLAVTSKLVSLAESRTAQGRDKLALIRSEADVDLGESVCRVRMTLKHGHWMPAAGIDESNSESGEYLLLPQDPFSSARALHRDLTQDSEFQSLCQSPGRFGILLTDSKSIPLRRGVQGIALAYWGFDGLRDRAGEPDLFHRPLQVTQTNLADSLAATSVLMMGEAAEQTPLAIIEQAPVRFWEIGSDPSVARVRAELRIDASEDLYLSQLEAIKAKN